MDLRRGALSLAILAASACGGGGPDYGERALASLTEECEGVSGLTGEAVLDGMVEQLETTLAHRDSSGAVTGTTPLSLRIVWPSAPSAVCYPEHVTALGTTQGPRVAIEGLEVEVTTDDGTFRETLAAKAWIFSTGGVLTPPQLLAVTRRSALEGSFDPDPAYDGLPTVTFTTLLTGDPSTSSGNVGLGSESIDDLRAGILHSRFAVATWPAP